MRGSQALQAGLALALHGVAVCDGWVWGHVAATVLRGGCRVVVLALAMDPTSLSTIRRDFDPAVVDVADVAEVLAGLRGASSA